MLLDIIRRLAARLVHFPNSSGKSPAPFAQASATPDYSIDPMWHGDHWQNLLSSPMDARRYVMEDWSVSPGLELAPVAIAAKR